MSYSIYPAAKVDLPGQQEQFEAVNRIEAEGFDPYDFYPTQPEWDALCDHEEGAVTITERVLSNAEAFEYVDQHLPAACNGDIVGALEGSTPEEVLDMLNEISPEPWPVTIGQFQRYLSR